MVGSMMDYGESRGSVSIQKAVKNAIMEEDDEVTVYCRGVGQEINADDKHPLLQVAYMKVGDEHKRRESSCCSWYFLIALVILLLVGASTFLLVTSYISTEGMEDEEIPLISRTMWNAAKPEDRAFLTGPANMVIVSHIEGVTCDNNCSDVIHDLQQSQMNPPNNFSDIVYNFVIGKDGWAYEGRGWGVRPEVAEEFDGQALAIAFIGDFNLFPPSELQVKIFHTLLNKATREGNLTRSYNLVGLRQLIVTNSTGEELYIVLRSWPNWRQCYMKSCIQETMQ